MNKVIKRSDGIFELIPDQQAREAAVARQKHREDLHLVEDDTTDLKTLAEVMQRILLRIHLLETRE